MPAVAAVPTPEDDLAALICLLASDDVTDHDARAIDESSHLTLHPAPDLYRQVPSATGAEVSATPTLDLSQLSLAGHSGLFSPHPSELDLDGFPPMSPTLPTVRSFVDMQNLDLKLRGAVPSEHDDKATSTALPLSLPDDINSAELPPVSPSLLSIADGGVEISRSPFFVRGPSWSSSVATANTTIGDMTQIPHTELPRRGLPRPLNEPPPQAPHKGLDLDVLGPSAIAEVASTSHSARAHLVADLAKARAELTLVKQEYAHLCSLVEQALPSAGLANNTPTSTRNSPTHPAPAPFATPARSPPSDSPADPKISNTAAAIIGNAQAEPLNDVSMTARDEIDALPEREAKAHLRAVLEYLSLPVSALQGLKSSAPVEPLPSVSTAGHFSLTEDSSLLVSGSLLPSPMPPSLPASSKSSSSFRSPAPFSLEGENPRSLADVRRAIDFVHHADELVWKRKQLAKLGVPMDGSSSDPLHQSKPLVPVDLVVMRDGSRVTLSNGPAHGTQKGLYASRVFDGTNILALKERLDLWESVVRARPPSRSVPRTSPRRSDRTEQ